MRNATLSLALLCAACSTGGVASTPFTPEAGIADATSVSDAGADVADDAPADVIDDYPYIDRGFSCARVRKCNPENQQICCAVWPSSIRNAFDGDGDNRCTTAADCDAGAIVQCNSQLDCEARGQPGAVCCVRYLGDAGAADAGLGDDASDAAPRPPPILSGIECVAPAACALPDDMLCDQNSPAPCPAGMQCVVHPVETRFHVCR